MRNPQKWLLAIMLSCATGALACSAEKDASGEKNGDLGADANRSIAIAGQYFDYLMAGNLEGAGTLFAEDIVWHQGGTSKVSGTYRGKAALFDHLGRFMTLSQGSFRIDKVDEIMGNGAMVAAHLHFSAGRNGRTIAMNGMDVLRFDGDKIQEVWLFSADQAAEDAFWTTAVEEEGPAAR